MDKYECLKIENQLCFPLYAASREVIKQYTPILDKYNLTYTQYIAMLVIWEKEKVTVKGIGKILHLDSGTLTPLLKKIESMGLITRYRDVNDDRVVIAELTQKGAELKEKIVGVPNEVLCKINLSREKAVKLKKLLDELLEIL
jgi:DNA-binding MarR family transcriptional regulator